MHQGLKTPLRQPGRYPALASAGAFARSIRAGGLSIKGERHGH
jgi:hypothetical protein